MARFKEEEPRFQKIRKKNTQSKLKRVNDVVNKLVDRCGLSGKYCYKSEKEIATKVNSTNKHVAKIRQDYYKCPYCGYWHITSMETGEISQKNTKNANYG